MKRNKPVEPLRRAKRKDRMVERVQPYIWDYLQDEDFTRFDSKQNFKEVRNPRTGETEKVHMRIWKDTNKQHHLYDFRESVHYANFQREVKVDGWDDRKPRVSYSTFHKALKKVGTFVVLPLNESCVDEIIDGLEQLMEPLFHAFRRERVKELLENYSDDHGGLTYEELYGVLRKSGAFAMVGAVLCEKVEQPDLHRDKNEKCPKLHKFECTHDGNGVERCKCCGIEKKLGILDVLEKSKSSRGRECYGISLGRWAYGGWRDGLLLGWGVGWGKG